MCPNAMACLCWCRYFRGHSHVESPITRRITLRVVFVAARDAIQLPWHNVMVSHPERFPLPPPLSLRLLLAVLHCRSESSCDRTRRLQGIRWLVAGWRLTDRFKVNRIVEGSEQIVEGDRSVTIT